MKSPPLSILLPVFNGGPLLRETLRSLFAQTFTEFELLVIDDASTDETAQLLREYGDPRLRVLTNRSNLGLTRSLNRGLSEARGELIARQDADDLSAPRRLEKQLAFLRANPAVELLGTSGWRLNPSGRITGSNDLPTTDAAIRWASVTDNPFLHTSVVFRREDVVALGGYDEQFAVCQDFDLWNRIAARGKVANLRERLVFMRQHPSSMTQTHAGKTSEEAARILQVNWSTIFPGRVFTPRERELLISFRLRVAPEKIEELSSLLDRLASEFLATHAQAKASRDFRETRCRQSLRLAYKCFASAPHIALRQIMRAFRESPRECGRQAWSVAKFSAWSRQALPG